MIAIDSQVLNRLCFVTPQGAAAMQRLPSVTVENWTTALGSLTSSIRQRPFPPRDGS